jgi:hypothetical protein
MQCRKRKLRFERLESRQLLTAGIEAVVEAGVSELGEPRNKLVIRRPHTTGTADTVDVTVEQSGGIITVTPGPNTGFLPNFDTTPRTFTVANLGAQFDVIVDLNTQKVQNLDNSAATVRVVNLIVPGGLFIHTYAYEDAAVSVQGASIDESFFVTDGRRDFDDSVPQPALSDMSFMVSLDDVTTDSFTLPGYGRTAPSPRST